MGLEVRLAVDTDCEALAVYADNLPVRTAVLGPVEELFNGKLGDKASIVERRIKSHVGAVDYLIGGPPCQGSSALNNFTRHTDPRNALYARMARAAEVLRPKIVLTENVPGLRHDAKGVVGVTRNALERAGYQCGEAIVDFVRLGIPQKRRRHILLATTLQSLDVEELLKNLPVRCSAHPRRSVNWAFADLRPADPMFLDAPSDLSAASAERIGWLFDHAAFELPNEHRPVCHRKQHSYSAMYGRLHGNSPAQTITSGFMTMGQGRYVHPRQRRTLTPHEAARLQTFPDYFSFNRARTRRALTRMIGNAVPPLANIILGEATLRFVLADTERDNAA